MKDKPKPGGGQSQSAAATAPAGAIGTSIAICLVVASVAAFLRLSRLELMEFKADERAAVAAAAEASKQVWPPVHGIRSSVGLSNPPTFVYLLSLPARWSTDPLVLARFVAVLDLLAVVALFWFVRRFEGVLVATIAQSWLACAPWSVLLSRKIWAQDVMTLFVIVAVAGLTGLYRRPTSRGWFLCAGVSIVIAAGIHVVGVFGVIVFAWVVVRARVRVSASAWLTLAAIGVGLYGRYVWEGAWRGRPGIGGDGLTLAPLIDTLGLLGPAAFDTVLGESAAAFRAGGWSVVHAVASVAGIAGGLLIALGLAGVRTARASVVPAVWCRVSIGVLIVLALRWPFHTHYLTCLEPIAMWGGASALVRLGGAMKVRARWVLVIALVIAAAGGWYWMTFLDFVEVNGGTSGDYGRVFEAVVEAR